ncbi:hypothetical protein WG622_16515 [Cognatishimia sp. D5M38]|uniref:Uncharacterized protein n=1 Tax=Cognatishimia coralii TaxID=3083254 RepID=A0ABU8QKB0_9RHOB
MHQMPFTGSNIQSLGWSGDVVERESASGGVALRETTGSPVFPKHGEVFSV